MFCILDHSKGMVVRVIISLVLSVFWLVPFYLAGSMLYPPAMVYSRLNFQYTAAGLFTRRIPIWTQTLYQVRTKYLAEWRYIDTAELSPMGAFGFRQRVDRVFQDTSGKPLTEQVRLRLAEWVALEYAKRHPAEGEVTGVRIGQTSWAANRPELAMPRGEWERNPVDLQPSAPFRAQASFTISQGKATPDLTRVVPSRPVPMRTPAVFQRKTKSSNLNPMAPQR